MYCCVLCIVKNHETNCFSLFSASHFLLILQNSRGLFVLHTQHDNHLCLSSEIVSSLLHVSYMRSSTTVCPLPSLHAYSESSLTNLGIGLLSLDLPPQKSVTSSTGFWNLFVRRIITAPFTFSPPLLLIISLSSILHTPYYYYCYLIVLFPIIVLLSPLLLFCIQPI